MYEANLYLSALLFIGAVLFFFKYSARSAFHPGTYYLFFHGLVFVVRPLFQYYLSLDGIYELYLFRPSESVKNVTLLAADIGLLTYILVTTYVAKLPTVFKNQGAQPYNRGGPQLLLTLLICSPLIISSSLYVMHRTADDALIDMVHDTSANIAIFTTTTGYFVDGNQMLGPLSVLIAWAFRFRLLSLLPFLLYLGLRMYLGEGRWTFLMAAASLALLYMYDKKIKWFSFRMLILGSVILFSFYCLGLSRTYLQDIIAGRDTQAVNFKLENNIFDNMDFANLEYLEYVISVVPEQTGTYDFFLRNLQVFTEPIPRIFWSGKPIGAPVTLYNLNDYGFPIGITWTLVGEGWQDLGILGVIIWCTFAGWITAVFYNSFMRSEQNKFQIAYYCTLLPLCVQWFRDGVLLTLLKFPLFYVIPISVWYVVCRVWTNERNHFLRRRAFIHVRRVSCARREP